MNVDNFKALTISKVIVTREFKIIQNIILVNPECVILNFSKMHLSTTLKCDYTIVCIMFLERNKILILYLMNQIYRAY